MEQENKIIRDEKGRFISGTYYSHWKGKSTWSKGLTKETDERVKKTTEKNRGQIRIKTRGWHEENRISDNPKGMLGKKASENTKKKMSESHKGHITTETTREKIRQAISGKKRPDMVGNQIVKNYVKEHPEEILRLKEQRAKQIFPTKDTKIEQKIQDYLKLLHVEFITHNYMSEITHAYQCDILIPKQETEGVIIPHKTIIECDGCYWHNCPICNLPLGESKLSERILEQKEKDKIRTKELIEKGYNVIRLWEHDIKVMELNDLKLKFK